MWFLTCCFFYDYSYCYLKYDAWIKYLFLVYISCSRQALNMKDKCMKILRIMISLVLLVPSAYAKEIADINFDEAIVVPGVSQNLQLNGLGIRYKFFFKI